MMRDTLEDQCPFEKKFFASVTLIKEKLLININS